MDSNDSRPHRYLLQGSHAEKSAGILRNRSKISNLLELAEIQHAPSSIRTERPAHPAGYNRWFMQPWASRLGITRSVLIHSARATVAAVVSMLVARAFKMPEFYWAPISAIVVLLSTIDPLALAWQRFAGTAVGVIIAALIATYFPPNWAIFGAGIFVCGIICAILRLGNAYRFAAIAVCIVALVPHTRPPSIIALHRFLEVSIGIAVALLITVVWPAPAS